MMLLAPRGRVYDAFGHTCSLEAGIEQRSGLRRLPAPLGCRPLGRMELWFEDGEERGDVLN